MNTEAIPMEQSMTTPNCKALFLGFMKLGLMGFGGVLPLAHRLIVEDQKWLTSEKFTDLLGVLPNLTRWKYCKYGSGNWL